MLSKFKTLLWFLKRSYYKQIGLIISRRIFNNEEKENSGLEATNWCKKNAILPEEAYLKITGKRQSFAEVEKRFEKIINESLKTAAACPVPMGGPGDMNILYNLAENIEAKSVIETGVAYGWSSLALLLSLATREGSKLISTDMPYTELNNEDFVGCVVPTSLKRIWKLIRYPDIEGLPKALKELDTIDLCHYDSDKSYAGRMWAYPKLWQALRPGGIFISDDIQDNLAFKEFSEQVNGESVVIKSSNKYVGVIKKIKN